MRAALFSQAAWLTAERIRRIALVFAIMAVAVLAGDAWMHTRAGVTDADGGQLGRDFINYWAGAKLAASGHAAQVYDLDGFVAFQRAHTAANAALKWYSYPPVTLLLTLPLAAFGFVTGLVLWLASGWLLNAQLLRRTLNAPWAALAAFATPASLMNALSGQNGAFTAALFGGAILTIEKQPWLAGALLGALCFKPHLALLLPLALIAGRQWRAFLAAGVSALLLCALSALLFGPDVWRGFLHNAPMNMTVLQTGTGFWPRMPTAFASVMMAGGGLQAAWAVQALCALAAAIVAAVVWARPAPMRIKGAVLILAGFLATPYAWDYDLVAVTFAVVWLVAEGRANGFAPYEKTALALAIAQPLLVMPLLALLHWQCGFLLLWPALLLAARRAWLHGRGHGLGAPTAAC